MGVYVFKTRNSSGLIPVIENVRKLCAVTKRQLIMELLK